MKTKNLFLTVVLLFIATLNYAQTSAEASGIAIQGIARDANNTARINTPITLTFELYYLDGTTIVPIGSPVDANLTTDNFGVFSYVLEAGVENNATMANQQAYLKISEGGTTISNEKLNHVPYAIAANNGVPTGSIMPFVGTSSDVPAGWALCNGQTLPTTATKLIAMIGNNAPDLGGMFLRGAGSNNMTSTETVLNETQDDDYKSHNHDSGSLVTSSDGAHKHLKTESLINVQYGETYTNIRIGFVSGSLPQATNDSDIAGNHTHSIFGNTDVSGGNADNNPEDTETRPVNYGVNYIIKL
ncbi:tail fiber protein [Winogradskyella sp. PG-2]|uniref:tail fiber protein n=1 Tax=Winogradskyella sp. PG-2 TaxID=754409 RepID=UPI0004586AA3|nr:tail fiber protein [Winogradskyella sp. PG-2]BAO74695.1 phage tail fibers [Winogradskyella sp. PG-2]